jgi:hypothetical protein
MCCAPLQRVALKHEIKHLLEVRLEVDVEAERRRDRRTESARGARCKNTSLDWCTAESKGKEISRPCKFSFTRSLIHKRSGPRPFLVRHKKQSESRRGGRDESQKSCEQEGMAMYWLSDVSRRSRYRIETKAKEPGAQRVSRLALERCPDS